MTSLPGQFGIGDLGPEAAAFCEALARAGQTYWQILPLGPTGYGDSPYQCFSAFALNPLLVSPQGLAEMGLVGDTGPFDDPGDRVDYGAVYHAKRELLSRAFRSFVTRDDLEQDFIDFQAENSQWLEDHALYQALKESQEHRAWNEWPDGQKFRDPASLDSVRESLADRITEQKFYQFVLFRQWFDLKHRANELGLKIIGDIPLFVSLDSADVWQHQDRFKLNADGAPRVVAGVPPDYFSSTGQLWGNPIYDWEAMRDDGYAWWVERVRASLRLFDVLRIDHFRGLVSTWEVPGGESTAENGEWVEVPARDLFERLRGEFGELAMIAEDLGFITSDVDELRGELGMPGMRILQYGFGGDAKNRDLPHNYVRNCVAYTGTHDNQTARGWFDSTGPEARDHCLSYIASTGDEIHWDMIRTLFASPADTAIVPLQDVLGLGDESKMNAPGSVGGNWQWRVVEGQFTDEHIERLRKMTELYGRGL